MRECVGGLIGNKLEAMKTNMNGRKPEDSGIMKAEKAHA